MPDCQTPSPRSTDPPLRNSSTVSTASTQRGRPGYDQQSVLLIAVDVFNRHGYDATSMGILAENLGISKSAIYHHVPSKGDLLRLALDHALGGLEAILDQPGATDRLGRGPAGVRAPRRPSRCWWTRLPFVTLLLRLRGNTEIERDALERRRDVRPQGRRPDFGRPRQKGRCARTSTPAPSPACCSAPSTRSSSGTSPAARSRPEKLADDVITMAFHGLHVPRCRATRQSAGPDSRSTVGPVESAADNQPG